jgi:hypothetical protein
MEKAVLRYHLKVVVDVDAENPEAITEFLSSISDTGSYDIEKIEVLDDTSMEDLGY